jgi:uncharacterized protein DUF3597
LGTLAIAQLLFSDVGRFRRGARQLSLLPGLRTKEPRTASAVEGAFRHCIEARSMSLFDTLKKAIFHNPLAPHAQKVTPPSQPAKPASGGAAPATSAATTAASGTAASTRPAAPVSSGQSSGATATPASTTAPVDVEAVLEALNARSQQSLNWRSSIVDLMKLVGLDSSLQHRKELADELGYTGDKSDSAAMNIWLHKAVMRKLAEHGGKVPASLQ